MRLPTHRLVLLAALAAASCAGRRPPKLGVTDGVLAPCPSSPNCVSSDDDEEHRVAPLEITAPPAAAWRAAAEAVRRLPRTAVVTETDDYLHAECRSALLGFVDDLELQLRTADRRIAVRSASRVGYSDLGVNRRRVEKLRSALAERGIVHP